MSGALCLLLESDAVYALAREGAGGVTRIAWRPEAPAPMAEALRAEFGTPRALVVIIGLAFLEIAEPQLPPVSNDVRVRMLQRDSDRYFALREPAAIVSGCVRAVRAELDGAPRSLAYAREAGDFLVWAQSQGGTGVFPFPAVRGVTRDKAFVAADRFLAKAEREGRLADVVRNGWAVDDVTDGGLQFDHGEAGVAMFELYEATKEKAYLTSAQWAADWAEKRPIARKSSRTRCCPRRRRATASTGRKPRRAAARAVVARRAPRATETPQLTAAV